MHVSKHGEYRCGGYTGYLSKTPAMGDNAINTLDDVPWEDLFALVRSPPVQNARHDHLLSPPLAVSLSDAPCLSSAAAAAATTPCSAQGRLQGSTSAC